MAGADLPLATRLWFAWLCFFRVLFDGAFAGRLWSVREAPSLPPGDGPKPTQPPPSPPLPPVSPPPAGPSPTPALQLLSLLQREGRLIDFLQQDIATFPDADIGAAARLVHEGCRKALRSHVAIDPVRSEDEGARVTLPAGFEADQVKLTGDLKGSPPYSGVLRHRGWRARTIDLPTVVGQHDARILAPAEVEIE
jgi:hypothetical protein